MNFLKSPLKALPLFILMFFFLLQNPSLEPSKNMATKWVRQIRKHEKQTSLYFLLSKLHICLCRADAPNIFLRPSTLFQPIRRHQKKRRSCSCCPFPDQNNLFVEIRRICCFDSTFKVFLSPLRFFRLTKT